MAPTLFADRIYTATELNRKSGELLTAAAEKPITVMGSSGPVVMQSRDRAALSEQTVFWVRRLSPLVLFLCDDKLQGGSLEPDLSFAAELSPEHRRAFLFELVGQLESSADSGDFSALEDVLSDWKATSEVDADAELRNDLKGAIARKRSR